ncbi:hypothetical protein GGR52DRAFT_592103 [Hypoxylon sp. FL1284]|nr:hypothetical protein GGR52DRAFT_592103 [Hypoxylon sp. FL1284]
MAPLRRSARIAERLRPGEVVVRWPPGNIPTELFVMIAKYLPYSDVKALRLVSREFNYKLVNHCFRQIIIRFGSQLSTTLDAGLAVPNPKMPSPEIPDFMQLSASFKLFGPVVRRLGFALELDEQDIATPDVDDTEDIVCTSNLIGRWPGLPKGLSQILENVTQSLERSRGISHALQRSRNIHELALSCVGGLGYLVGPDINPYQPPAGSAIFGDPPAARSTPDYSYQTHFEENHKIERLHRQLAIKGVKPKDFHAALEQLMAAEDMTYEEFTREKRPQPGLPENREIQQIRHLRQHIDEAVRLHPNALTTVQAILVFNHLSAQQALISSFKLAVIDCGPRLRDLTKLNIARLPSFFVEQMCCKKFWAALPRVQEVFLGVDPDWTSVSQDVSGAVSVQQVYPTDAMPGVFNLLKSYIGKRPNIKRLHFEWNCGGELAPGCMQRNKNILPAPFLKQHRKIILSSIDNLLILPHVEHLSLKNCWFAPNVFYRAIKFMTKYALQSIELEGVSLSGPPTTPRQNNMAGFAAELEDLKLLFLSNLVDHNKDPPNFTWSRIIDLLTPGPTIKEHVYEQRKRPEDPKIRLDKEVKALRKLVFKSCGYVSIPDTRFVSHLRLDDVFSPGGLAQAFLNVRQTAIEKNLPARTFSHLCIDRHLGTIAPLMNPWEKQMMERVFGFTFGWADLYGADVEHAATHDGVFMPGEGRFSGTIERELPKTEDGDEKQAGKEHEYDRVVVPYTLSCGRYNLDYDDSRGLEEVLLEVETEAGYDNVL